MTVYRFFSIKMFKLQHQFNNIVETTQSLIRRQNSIVTVNVRSVHRQLQALTRAFSRLIWEVFYSLVLGAGCPK